jgi:hypothetical protein
VSYPARRPLSLEDVRALLRGAAFPWWIAGGWALDLHLGRQTRPHSDVDIAILREDQQKLAEHLAAWEFEYVDMAANRRVAWTGTEQLRLPIHELWARPSGADAWQAEFLLNERRDDQWVFRRDPSISRSFERFPKKDGLPFLPPEIVLLYKSSKLTPTNQTDYAVALDSLDEAGCAWLRQAIAKSDPAHPWLTELV